MTDKKAENRDNPSRDEVLKRMLKMKPQPHQKPNGNQRKRLSVEEDGKKPRGKK